jgi:hypothetical protein
VAAEAQEPPAALADVDLHLWNRQSVMKLPSSAGAATQAAFGSRFSAGGSPPGVRPSVFGVRISSFGLALLLLPAIASARINVVTLPGRNSVQLTIYNSADLTMVKETRVLTFRKGLNKLEFSWANTLIDPTSVEFRALSHADQVDVLDVSFPPRVTNTLEWRINSEVAGEVKVEIRYFTSGISWSADYVAEASKDEKGMELAGNVRVNNKSGEDYENAQVRLVVGVIRLVEDIARLAQAGQASPTPPLTPAVPKDIALGGRFDGYDLAINRAEERLREIVKEELGEYFLYTVEGRDTIPNGWSKRLPSFKTNDVPITSYYKFEKERWGDNVTRFYRFTNSAASKLGSVPLPDGAVKAFRLVATDQLLSFVGNTTVKYIPVNETVEMELGNDREVLVKPRLMNWTKTEMAFDNYGNIKGWTIKETWEIEVQNSKDIDVVLDVRRNFNGDWALTTDASYERVDATKVKFLLPLQPRARQTFTYEVTTHHGTNANR